MSDSDIPRQKRKSFWKKVAFNISMLACQLLLCVSVNPVLILLSVLSGIVLLFISGSRRGRYIAAEKRKWMRRAGIWMVAIPIVLCLYFELMYESLFGPGAFVLTAVAAFLFMFVARRGSVAFLICGLIPVFFLTRFQICSGSLSNILILLLLIPAFITRKMKYSLSYGTAFALFLMYFSLIYSAWWYTSPMNPGSVKTDGDPAVRHLSVIESEAVKAPFPRSFYAIREGCEKDRLYALNLFNSPGIIEWQRGDENVIVHHELEGVAEDIDFDCETGEIRIAEYLTGKLLVYQDDLSSSPRELPTRIHKPCREYHYPGSDLFYYNGDEASFPWFIVDRSGKMLMKIETGTIEEVVPLEDDTFIISYGGSIYRKRFDHEKNELETVSSAEMPDGILRFVRRGPLYQHLRYNHENGVVFIADFNTGKIYRLTLEDMSMKVLASLKRGIRHLELIPEYRAIAVGNYATGTLTMLDMDTGEVFYKRNIGSRLRRVSRSTDGEVVYATSRAGLFEFSMNAIRTGPTPRKPRL